MLKFGAKFKVLSLILVLIFLLSCYGCKTIEEETSGTLSQTPAINNESDTISIESNKSVVSESRASDLSQTTPINNESDAISSQSSEQNQSEPTQSEPTQNEPTKEPSKGLQLVIPDNPKGSRYSDVLATDDGGFIIIGYDWADKNGSYYPISTVEKYNSKCEQQIKKKYEEYQFISVNKTTKGDIVVSAKCWNGIDYFNILIFGSDLTKKAEIKLGNDLIFSPIFSVLSDGNIAVSCFKNDEMLINIFNISGQLIKEISIGKNIDYNTSNSIICPINGGGFYITLSANIAENDYFKPYGSKGGKDIYIAKYNKDYSLEKVINLGGSANEYNKYISIAKDGSLFVIFNSDSNDKDLAGLGLPGKSTAQILFKIDNNGKIIFKSIISGKKTDYLTNVFVLELSNGDIAVCGSECYDNGILSKYKIDYCNINLGENFRNIVNYEMLLDKNGKIKNIDMVWWDLECVTYGAALLKDGRIIIAGCFSGSTVPYGGTKTYDNAIKSYCIYDIYAYKNEK